MKTKLVRHRLPGVRSLGRSARIHAASPSAPRVQIQTILVPIDFSEPSAAALRYAARFAEQFGARLFLLHVVEPVATPDFACYPLVMDSDKVAAAARIELDGIVSKNKIDSELIGKKCVRTGVAFREITGAAESLKADLIIIATHGYTGLKHVLLGSTTERVVRHATRPVLVVRNESAP